MFTFFLHKKFWLPIIIIILLIAGAEFALRHGLANNLIKPTSILGEGINRRLAVENFGREKVNWITIGDSRLDWGMDHGLLKNKQLTQGLNHIRMSLPGSGFMAIQTTIDWSIKNFPNLKGIVVGVAGYNLTQFSSIEKQTKVIWPFRQSTNHIRYRHSLDNKLPGWYNQLHIYHYFSDIKNYLLNPVQRQQKFTHYKKNIFPEIFEQKRVKTDDLCQYNLDDLNACAKAAEQIKNKVTNRSVGEKFIMKQCAIEKLKPENQASIGQLSAKAHIKNWHTLLEHTAARNIETLLVLLPEHELMSYTLRPKEQDSIVQAILQDIKKYENINLLDLRNLFNQQQCAYYSDPIHFNTKGSEIITSEIIDSLN